MMPSPIRIVRIVDRLSVGGATRQVLELSSRIQDESWQSVLITGTMQADEHAFPDWRPPAGLRIEQIQAMSRAVIPWRDMVALWRLVKYLRAFRPHIVHTHKAKAGFLGRLAARLAGVPLVIHTYHGHVLRGYFSELVSTVFRNIESLLARITDAIVVLSPSQREELLVLGIGRRSQYRVLRSGVDVESFSRSGEFKGQFRAELGLAAATPIIACVGRLVPIKCHEILLAAAGDVLVKNPACRFLIIGDGERRAYLEELARDLRVADKVDFLGFRSDLARIYSDIDMLVICSRSEGLPMCAIEAMAAGKPVVGTAVGGTADLIAHGRNGLLIPPDNALALAEAIQKLLENRDLAREMGEMGRNTAEKYGILEQISEAKKMYVDLLTSKLDKGGVT